MLLFIDNIAEFLCGRQGFARVSYIQTLLAASEQRWFRNRLPCQTNVSLSDRKFVTLCLLGL